MSSLYEQISTDTSRTSSPAATATANPVDLAAALAGELSSERRRIEVITTILGGWIWETDAEHRFTYMSPSVERYAGKPATWHYGKTRQELGNMSVRTVDGRSWVEQLEAHSIFGPIDFIRYQGGKTLVMRTIGHPQFDATGAFKGYCGIAFELPADAEPERDERRGSERRRLVRAAEIITAGEAGAVSCVLVDISQTGARLRVPDDAAVPSQFRLVVAAMSIDIQCDVRWRRADEIGVEFNT